MSDESAAELATELTIAWLGNHNSRIVAEDVPAFLKSMYEAVVQLAGASPEIPVTSGPDAEVLPATTVRRSLASRDYIISLIDGKPYKALRRHLLTHGLTPEQYRQRYRLKPDYPMVAPAYSETRRAMALKIGLGKRDRAARGAVATPAKKPKRAPRAPKK